MIKIKNVGENSFMLFDQMQVIEFESAEEKQKTIVSLKNKLEISNFSFLILGLSQKQMERFKKGFRFTQTILYKGKTYGYVFSLSNVFIFKRRNIIKSAYD